MRHLLDLPKEFRRSVMTKKRSPQSGSPCQAATPSGSQPSRSGSPAVSHLVAAFLRVLLGAGSCSYSCPDGRHCARAGWFSRCGWGDPVQHPGRLFQHTRQLSSRIPDVGTPATARPCRPLALVARIRSISDKDVGKMNRRVTVLRQRSIPVTKILSIFG